MSVLIKGMEMPEKIEPSLVIEFADGINGKRYARLHHDLYGGLTNWFEAVPVPPHGKLIEKHDVFKLIQAFPEIDKLLTVEFMTALYNLPTIIPAEENNHND